MLLSSLSVLAWFTHTLRPRVRLLPPTFASTSDFEITHPPPPTPRQSPPASSPHTSTICPSSPFSWNVAWADVISPPCSFFRPMTRLPKGGVLEEGREGCGVLPGVQCGSKAGFLFQPPLRTSPLFYLSFNKQCCPLKQLPCRPCCFSLSFLCPLLFPSLPLSPRCH